jgi:hypothetical protein
MFLKFIMNIIMGKLNYRFNLKAIIILPAS